MKNFVLIGAAGYIAPKHFQAIKETGNNLLAAMDPHDSVGILDSYFPDTDFFTEFERFDRHCEKLKRQGKKIDYVVVCSPNYLHDAHCRFGLRIGADVICEKPVVLNPWNLEALIEMEKETGKKIYPILQLRYHPEIIALKEKIDNEQSGKKYKVELKYITPRGKWYHYSWKGDEHKSGGLAANIGIHFFDLLLWIFGDVVKVNVLEKSNTKVSGFLELQKAEVQWLLSIDSDRLQRKYVSGAKSFRVLIIDGVAIDLSNTFENLHTMTYNNILNNSGLNLSDAVKSIDLVYNIRNMK
ncbi:MAG: Gfo/Idh/MocA family oxidoreductase [Bacteroidetes bacterium]|nr:Gfo/Idh/MocA family oxidoreductase [Bacteroidota bacterium]